MDRCAINTRFHDLIKACSILCVLSNNIVFTSFLKDSIFSSALTFGGGIPEFRARITPLYLSWIPWFQVFVWQYSFWILLLGKIYQLFENLYIIPSVPILIRIFELAWPLILFQNSMKSSKSDPGQFENWDNPYVVVRFHCRICDKELKPVKSYWKTHYDFHSNERNYKCSFCGKAFTTSSNMKRHEKSHFKEQMKEENGLREWSSSWHARFQLRSINRMWIHLHSLAANLFSKDPVICIIHSWNLWSYVPSPNLLPLVCSIGFFEPAFIMIR